MSKSNKNNAPETIKNNNQASSNSATKKVKTQKVLKSIAYIVVILCLLFLVVIVVQLCIDKFKNKSPVPSAFGYASLTIQTGSMSGTLEIGDMIIIKGQDDYKIGDIVTFLPQNDVIPTTHRIVRMEGDKIYTKGDNNNSEDGEYITKANIYGKVVCVLSGLGLFTNWFTQGFGWLFFVGGLLIIIVGVYLLKHFLPKKQKE